MLVYRIEAYALEKNTSNEDENKTGYQKRREAREKSRLLSNEIRHFNNEISGNGFFTVASFDEELITIVAIVSDVKILNENQDKFIELVGGDINDKIVVKEITTQDATILLDDAERDDYIESASEAWEKMGVPNFGRYGSRRNLPFGENTVEEKSKDELLTSVKDTLFYETMEPEINRIFESKREQVVYGHPVHYLMICDGQSETRKIAYRSLIQALYSNKRIGSSRYLFVDIDGNERFDASALETYFKVCKGGTIVVRVCPTDATEDANYASHMRGIMEKIGEIVQRYQNDVLTICAIPKNSPRTISMYYEYTGKLSIVELSEIKASKEYASIYLEKYCLNKNVEADDSLYEMLDKDKVYSSDELEKVFELWYSKKIKNDYYPEYQEIYKDSEEEKNDKIASCSAYQELMNMIGLESAKKTINDIINYFKAQKLFKSKGITCERPALSMAFMGNPGTAKTSVARLVAEIFKDEGILTVGNLVECSKSDLVGKYVGWTSKQVEEKFKEATGGVLFIDECYDLATEHAGGYGTEAINMITQMMENHRDDVLVIFAGYSDKMQDFLDKNPGLRSRIAFHVNFDDYSVDELCEISTLIAKKKGLNISNEAMEKLKDIYFEAKNAVDFGNGRAVRNIIEQSKMAMCNRIMKFENIDSLSDEETTTLLPEDITYNGQRIIEPKRVVGF